MNTFYSGLRTDSDFGLRLPRRARLRARMGGGFTLIEMMIATALGLMLLAGLVKIIAMVNTSFAETRVLIDLQNRCRSAQMLLQQDMSHISVVPHAPRPFQMDDGYLSLGSLPNTFTHTTDKTHRGDLELVYTQDGLLDDCDFVAFTVFNRETPFSFVDPGNTSRMLQTPYAEVVWFVYRNDLYRVMVPFVNSPENPRNYLFTNGSYSTSQGARVSGRIPAVRMISPGLLGDLQNRLMCNGGAGSFIWSNCSTTPNSGVALQLANSIVLPNVLAFKVQVYDPKLEEYRDLDSMDTDYFRRKTFRYAGSTPGSGSGTVYYDSGSTLSYLGATASNDRANVYVNEEMFDTNYYQPPTTAFLPGMRIIVRAFDPDTGTIREFRVGQDFRTR